MAVFNIALVCGNLSLIRQDPHSKKLTEFQNADSTKRLRHRTFRHQNAFEIREWNFDSRGAPQASGGGLCDVPKASLVTYWTHSW
jgi:hypothetical protein